MLDRRAESGEGRIGCIFWALVLVAGAIFLFHWVPMKMKTAEMYDFMVDQATFASQHSAAGMKKRILDKANELDLPVGAKNLTVTKESERVRMHTEYTITLDFGFGLSHDFEFVHDIDRPIYYY